MFHSSDKTALHSHAESEVYTFDSLTRIRASLFLIKAFRLAWRELWRTSILADCSLYFDVIPRQTNCRVKCARVLGFSIVTPHSSGQLRIFSSLFVCEFVTHNTRQCQSAIRLDDLFLQMNLYVCQCAEILFGLLVRIYLYVFVKSRVTARTCSSEVGID